MEMTVQKPQKTYRHAYAFPQNICIQNADRNVVGSMDKFYGNFPRNKFFSHLKNSDVQNMMVLELAYLIPSRRRA
jgi:hypothetical protein